MKKIFVLLLLLTTPSYADCVLNQTTNTELSGQIQSVKNIEKFISPWADTKRKCSVEFTALINDKWHRSFGSYIFENSDSVEQSCDKALDNGKKNLLQELFPQSLKSKDTLLCTDIKTTNKSGLEGLQLNTSKSSFTYQGSNCGWFYETKQDQRGLYQWNVIACELKPDKWTIIDKF